MDIHHGDTEGTEKAGQRAAAEGSGAARENRLFGCGWLGDLSAGGGAGLQAEFFQEAVGGDVEFGGFIVLA